MSGINIDALFKPVVYENIVQIGNNIIANEFGYDHFICAGLNPVDESFSNYIIQYFGFTTLGASAFDANISSLPPNYPSEMVYYKRNVSSIRDDKNANLEYFIGKYSNIFLKMDLNGAEYDWFSSLDVDKLKKFKQIVIRFLNSDSFDDGTKLYAFGLLNETHYVVRLAVEDDIISVVYLRKELIALPVPVSDFDSENKLTVEIPEDNDIILNCPTPIPRVMPLSIEVEVVPESEILEESIATEVVEVVPESEILEESIATEVVEVLPETEVLEESIATEVVEVVPETEVLEESIATEVVEVVPETEVLEESIATEVVEVVPESEILEESIATEVVEVVPETEVLEESIATEVVEVVPESEILEESIATEVVEVVPESEILEESIATEVEVE